MAWGDGIKPEDKIYKGQGTNTDLGITSMVMVLLVIAIAISYLAYSKYREREEMEEAAIYLKQIEKEYEQKAETALQK